MIKPDDKSNSKNKIGLNRMYFKIKFKNSIINVEKQSADKSVIIRNLPNKSFYFQIICALFMGGK